MNPFAARHLTDKEILSRYRQDHDREWVGILFYRYLHLLLGVCMKYLKNEEDAKDGVQQIFLKVLGDLHRHEIVYFKAWIYQVTKNYCLMQLRNPDLKKRLPLSEALADIEEKPPVKEDLLAADRLMDSMRSGLESLCKEQHTCVSMFYLHGKSYQEIVNITGYTLLQVKSYIQNGKRNLKIFIEKETGWKKIS